MTTSGTTHDRAGSEAAHWLVALEDDPDNGALRARFEAWRSANPAHAAAWVDTKDVYALMAKVGPSHARQRTAPVAPARAPRTLRCRLGLGAIGAAIAACLALIIAPALVLRIQADHLTATAELRMLRLNDGSTVHLGPESAIAVTLGASERRVRLLKGEAFFEVTPDPDRPFRVSAHEIDTIVVGTAFSVRLGDDDAAVGVRRGRVRVENRAVQPPVSETLTAGNWIRLAKRGPIKRGTVAPDEIAAWVDGQIVARDRPLADVVEELRPYYAGKIVVPDQAFGQQRVTGVYNIADPGAALQAIAGAHGGSVRQISPWLMLVSGR
jgi:transmembrane sensor